MKEAFPEEVPAPSSGGRRRGVLRLIGLVVVIGAAAVYVWTKSGDLSRHVEWRPALLAWIALSELLLLLTRGLMTRGLARIFGVRLGIGEGYRLAVWTGLANYVSPMVGGTGVRAAYLKRRHGLAYTDFASVQAATYAMHFSMVAVVGLLSIGFVEGLGSDMRRGLALLFGATIFGALILRYGPLRPPGGEGRFAARVRQLLAGRELIRSAPLAGLWLVFAVNLALQVLAVWFSFALVDVTLGPWQVLFVATIGALSLLVSITPAALGILEAAVMGASALLGVPPIVALSAAASRRLVIVAVLAGSAAWSLARGRDPREGGEVAGE